MMSEKTKNILWSAVTLLAVFLSVNWIYSRIWLSGWIPLYFSILIFVGAVYQTFDLIGKLIVPSANFARKLSIAAGLLIITLGFSGLFIFDVLKDRHNGANNREYIALESQMSAGSPSNELITVAEEPYLPEPLVIYVGEIDYRIDGDTTEGAIIDLDALIETYQDLTLNRSKKPVVISAESDIAHTRVIELMDALMAIGVNDISLATKEKR